MGAADEGYEEVVVNLLMAIDARRKQAGGGKSVKKQGVGSGRRGSRKLKGFVSSINSNTREDT